MSSVVYKLMAELGLDKSKFDSGISEASGSTNTFSSLLQSKFGSVGDLVSEGLQKAGEAIIDVGEQAYQSASDYEQLTGGIETLFGAQGMSLKDYAKSVGQSTTSVKGQYNKLIEAQNDVMNNAKNAYKTAGMSVNEYMDTVSSFAASLKQSTGDNVEAAKKADEAVQDMADNANKMGTDMSSIQMAYNGFAKQNYTMLDNLKLGYGGTQSEMKRLLSDAQKLTGVKYDINNLSDVYDAIHAIQQNLGITGTTAKEAMGTIQGSADMTKSAWEDVITSIGTGEDLKQSFQSLNEAIFGDSSGGGFLSNAANEVLKVIQGMGEAISDSGPTISAALTTLVNNLLPDLITAVTSLIGNLVVAIPSLLAGLMDAIRNVIQNLPQTLSTIAKNCVKAFQNIDWAGLGKSIIDFIESGIKAVFVDIPTALVNIGKEAWNWFNSIDWNQVGLNVIKFIGNAIKSMFTEVPTELKKIGQQAFNWFKSIDWVGLGKSVITFIGNAIKGLFTSIPSLIKSIGQSAFNLFKSIDWAGLGKSVINFIRNAIHGLFNSIPQLLKSIGSSAKSSFENINWKGIGSNVINWISNGIKGLINNIPKVLSSIASRAKSSFTSVNWGSIGSNVISGIASGISRGIGSVISAAQRVARNALSAAKRALGIHSPSTVFRDEVGAMISKGMGIGIDDNAPIDTVQNTMANIISAAKDGISNVDIPISASVSNGANGDSIAQIQADTTKDIYSFITGKMVTQLANVIADKLTVELDGREVGRVVKKYA